MTVRTASRTGRGPDQRILGAAVGCLVLLSACTGTTTAEPEATPAATSDAFTLASLPHLDGSTASIPLLSLILQKLADVPKAQADNVETSTTPTAYNNIACGPANPKSSVVIAGEPAQAIKDGIAGCAQLEYHPIGRDALVFLVNESNPVGSLTTAQLADIYSGKTTNWKAVGGADQKIVAYQQSKTAGSQALLDKFVMADAQLAPAPAQIVLGEKGTMTEGLANYDNADNAIGYSVFYYAKELYAAPDTKLLAVGGVAPSAETIADGTYPYVNDFYAVIRADEPEASPARRVVAWLESLDGQIAIASAGYVANK